MGQHINNLLTLKNEKLFVILLIFAFFILSFPNLSQSINIGEAPAGNLIDIPGLLMTILTVMWPVVVTVVVIFFVLAGFKFLTAQGNPEELKIARRFLIWGVVGVIVIILSFSILISIRITLGL